MVHLVVYELRNHRSRTDYDCLIEAIKGISGKWCRLGESKWLIETELSTCQVSSRLAPFTIAGDPLLVSRQLNDWSGYSLTQEQLNWLNSANFGSLAESFALLPPPPIAAPNTLLAAILQK